ncbi:MAG: hypothetical protein AAF591_17735 [Verrucomicrobiota bacterium]
MGERSIGRRHFLRRTAAGGALVGMGDFGFLRDLPAVTAEEARPDPERVAFLPDIEGTVRLIEETPRADLLEAVGRRVRSGKLSYQEVLSALMLAGVRNIQPRPSVGFKFHAVLVVNSAHLASLASPDGDRWLPIFWALDEFKKSEARDIKEGGWTMGPVDEARVPPPRRAKRAFIRAMDRWDVEGADAAAAGLARGVGAQEVFELFAEYGVRDFRSIGHKAIYVANSWRTLQTMGWRHAEPVLRSLAYALLNHNGEPNPSESDLAPDRPWRENEVLAEEMGGNWRGGAVDGEATTEMLEALRSEGVETVCGNVAAWLGRGVSPQSMFDAFFAGSGELLMRQPGIVALHAMTSTNALRYIYETVSGDRLRRRVLLQNAAFLPLFREAMRGRGEVRDERIDDLQPLEMTVGGGGAIEEIFDDVGRDGMRAARRLLGYLDSGGLPEPMMDVARRLIFLKGTDSHDYKFSSAVLEDFYEVSPEWRNRMLAASVFKLRGAKARDNALVKRTREALS